MSDHSTDGAGPARGAGDGSAAAPARGKAAGKAEELRRRAASRSPGLTRFLDIYRDARLLPFAPADSELVFSLEACLGCGNCLPACPVVAALGGHSYPGPRTVATSLSRSLPEFWASADIAGLCTTCMACEEVCPGDVPVYRAILMMRAKNFEQKALEGEEPLSRVKRLVVDFFAGNKMAQAARWGAVLQGLAFKRTAEGEMKARVPIPLGPLGNRLIPPLARRSLAEEFLVAVPGKVSDGPKVAVFAGCLYNYAYTDTGRSLIDVLRRHCREVVVPAGQVCCGAPALYSGDLPTTRRLAAENARVFEATGADFVVTACASCGDVLSREYPRLAQRPNAATPTPPAVGSEAAAEATSGVAASGEVAALAGSEATVSEAAGSGAAGSEAAAEVARVRDLVAKTRDVHAFLTGEVRFRAPGAGGEGAQTAITIHDPCHLTRGQGLSREVRQLARAIPGVEVREMEGAGVCCGGAGSFSLDHYAIASAIRDQKVAAIDRTGAGTVITGCPSCRMHISDGLGQAGRSRPVRHLVDLLAEAYECPRSD